MGQRLELQYMLEEVLGSRNVYFQPPSNIVLKFPCIVYNRERYETTNADNLDYLTRTRYEVTVIDRDPESDIPRRVNEIPNCSHNRFFTNDGLNHDVFELYF